VGGEGREIELGSGGRRRCLSTLVGGLNAGAHDCPPVNIHVISLVFFKGFSGFNGR